MRINEFIPNTDIYSNLNIKNNDEKVEKGNNNVSFANMLKDKLSEVNEKQLDADKTTESFIKGEDVDIHDVMIKTEEAKLSLELAVQVRNKLIEAYQEISRMQV